MNLDNDYDNDGNNIVPCPICLDVHCPSKEDGKCPVVNLLEFVEKLLDKQRNSIHTQSALEAEGRERQLKTVHEMELDAISCKSIEDFVLWRDHRKNRPSRLS